MMISIQIYRTERSNEVLRKCDELLKRSTGFQSPLLEKKKASLERRKKEQAAFLQRMNSNEHGTHLIFSTKKQKLFA